MAVLYMKSIIFFLLFLVSAGCSVYEPSSSAAAKAISAEPVSAEPSFAAPGPALSVQGQSSSDLRSQMKPADSIVFADSLNGFGMMRDGDAYVFMQTDNGGETWTAKYTFHRETAVYGMSFLNKKTGWVLASTGSSGTNELLLTSDGGETWEVIAGNVQELGSAIEKPFFRFFDRQNGLIAVNGAKGFQLLRSQDGGLTWTLSGIQQLPKDGRGVFTFVSPTNGWYAAATKKAKATVLYHTNDGENWIETGKLRGDQEPAAIAFSDAQTGWLLLRNQSGSGTQGWSLLRTTDEGQTWVQHDFPAIFDPAPKNVYMTAVQTDRCWVMSTNGLWRSLNGGLNWNRLAS